MITSYILRSCADRTSPVVLGEQGEPFGQSVSSAVSFPGCTNRQPATTKLDIRAFWIIDPPPVVSFKDFLLMCLVVGFAIFSSFILIGLAPLLLSWFASLGYSLRLIWIVGPPAPVLGFDSVSVSLTVVSIICSLALSAYHGVTIGTVRLLTKGFERLGLAAFPAGLHKYTPVCSLYHTTLGVT